MTDEAKRVALVRLLEPYMGEQDCYLRGTLVPLELFFEGNDDKGSIGCNLPKHPGLGAFYDAFLKLRARPDVSGVWVLAKQHDWKPGWPHSDEILVRTRAGEKHIRSALDHLEPDEVGDALLPRDEILKDVVGASAACDPGERFVIAWWD